MPLLSSKDIEQKLTGLSGWEFLESSLQKNWVFADFIEAMRFINHVAEVAEKLQHHPEIWNVYNRVRLTLSTHDAGGVTEKDFLLAKEIDENK